MRDWTPLNAAHLTAVLALLLTTASPARAASPASLSERAEPRRNIISVIPVFGFGTDPAGEFIWGDLGARFNYERMLTRHHGLLVEVGLYAHRLHFEQTGFIRALGLDAAVGYRWHWEGPADSGFYGVHAGTRVIGPELSATHDLARAPFISLFLAGNLGYRWVWSSGPTLTVRGGPGYQFGVEADNPFGDRFYFDAEVSAGWRF